MTFLKYSKMESLSVTSNLLFSVFLQQKIPLSTCSSYTSQQTIQQIF